MIDILQDFLTLVSCVIVSPTEGDNFISVCHSAKFCQLQTSSCFLAIMVGSHNISPGLHLFLLRVAMLFVYHSAVLCVSDVTRGQPDMTCLVSRL